MLTIKLLLFGRIVLQILNIKDVKVKNRQMLLQVVDEQFPHFVNNNKEFHNTNIYQRIIEMLGRK